MTNRRENDKLTCIWIISYTQLQIAYSSELEPMWSEEKKMENLWKWKEQVHRSERITYKKLIKTKNLKTKTYFKTIKCSPCWLFFQESTW